MEKILPVGSFFEKTKICAPNEFDFDIKLNVGKIDIYQGCRPGRVQVTFESSRQKWLEILGTLFCSMIDAALKTMTSAEKNIRRESGTLHITSKGEAGTQARLQFEWKGTSHEFDIYVDVVPSIPCTDIFIAELAKNEHFPSSFHQLVKDQPCYLVPKPCSPNCQKCFHVSFSQAELYLMQSLDDEHRECYRVMKWLLAHHDKSILHTYQLKTAVLYHVYNSNCQSKGCIDKCVLAMLAFLLDNYNKLKMPNFFMPDCCSITKDGEGTQCYLDYLVDATGLDMSLLPLGDVGRYDGYKNYDWLDMFGWYEFQRRCLSLMIDVLSQVGSKFWLSYGHMVRVLTVFFESKIGGLSSQHKCSASGRPTMREWRDKVPNFSQRIFIPAFSLILEVIQVLLKNVNFYVPGVWSTPSIRLCLPCPTMGYSQGSIGSAMWRNGDRLMRQGAMCYFAQLEGSSWYPVAFGKMSFIEPYDEFPKVFFSRMSFSQEGPRSQLIRGNTQKADAEVDEIPDFEGPFHFNVRYDGEAFQENIVSRWHYKRCLIEFLLYKMVVALQLTTRPCNIQ